MPVWGALRTSRFTDLSENSLAIKPFTHVEGSDAAVDFRAELLKLSSTCLVVIFPKAKGFSHDFADRAAAARSHLRLDEVFEFGHQLRRWGEETMKPEALGGQLSFRTRRANSATIAIKTTFSTTRSR